MPVLPLDEGHDPREVGPYRLLGRLGEGGQGVVYLGEAPDGRQVAVKTLKLDGLPPGADAEARRRLAKEVEAAMRVEPFCTARVLDFSVEGPLPYVVGEYVPGPSLFERVDEQGPLHEDALIRLIIQSVSGLTAIHDAGIVHRDLKPSNLLMGPDGARVVDFGIARLAEARTRTGRLIGTPSYFSPEQLEGRPATTASDVFAWAGTMVFAATGRAPFGYADYDHEMPALFRRILEDEPDLGGVPERVLPLLRLCLDKDPANRPVAWSILEWLLKRPAPRTPTPVPADPFTADAFRLLDRVAPSGPSGPPIRLPPPGPPPVGVRTVPPAEPDTVPPAEGDPVPPIGHEPAPLTERGHVPAANEPGRPVNEPDPTTGHGSSTSQQGGPGRPVRRWWPVAAVLALVVAGAGGWLLLGRGGEAETRIPERFAGTWQGQVAESDGYRNRPATVTLSLPEGGRTGALAGGLCAGQVALSALGQDRITLEFTSGSCVNGTVVATLDGDRLDYDLRGGGSATGHGTLGRSAT
ncbi:Serine/threonine protein kinase [Thermomonospora echinospora]|uniref:Serine/threonine protein kinase n=1 Tax=Thermomonospora echinospora TaxID=1992 RepID=A0A1H5UZ17_9ACTN|nr:serine/threonine-protein kinase [Thermomonospora echinospora]SEF80345.1 Serine/threonine protein kinase [Thermomonospora echinospora]